MRDYDVSLIEKIREKQYFKNVDGLNVLIKRVPDDDRDNVLDPRVRRIAEKKKKRISGLKKGYSLASERFRPDKICYDLTATEISVEERLIPVANHMIDIFIYRPRETEGKLPLVIFYHGGGFTAGDMKLYVNQMKLICELSKAVVIFPEYRLAPENPFPAQIVDAEGTISWALKNADYLNIDPEKLMICGDSAGGSIVNSVIIRDTEKHVKKAFEIYPGVDSTTLEHLELYQWSYDMYPVIEEQKELAFSRIDKIRKVSHGSEKDSLYLQGRTRYNNPEVSIVYATDDQLKQLPPIVIAYSEYDFLRVSDEYFARRLTGVNHDVKAIMYCGCDHGFLDCLGLVPQAEELCHVIAEEVSTL